MITKFDEFQNNEGFKGIVAGGLLGLGALAGAGAYVHDKMVEPREVNQTKHVDIPDDFIMKEKILAWGTEMWITNDNRDNFGKIEEKVLSWGTTFKYYDNTGKLQATAKEKVFTLYTQIEIFDANGQYIGMVEQEILESLASVFWSVYSIKDASGNVIAKSEKINLLANRVDIEGRGTSISIREKLLTIGDVYQVSISGNEIDRRLIIFIPNFISAAKSDKD